MPLSQDDRVSFSKKLVEAPFLIIAAEKAKAGLEAEKVNAQKLDNGHKNLVDGKTVPIDGYQAELTKLDGFPRSNLTESDQQNAASMVLGNFFYPNDTANPPPSLAPSVWTKTKPYAKNKAVGKFYNEQYGTLTTSESSLIASIQSDVSSIQSAYVLMERVTGQHCITTGFCSLPAYTTQPTCVAGGGLWTPGPDSIVTYPEMQTAMTNLISKVNSLKSFLLTEVSSIYLADTNTTRKNESQAAVDNINNVIIPAINAWLAVQSFNTAHGQTSCAGFYSYNAALLAPTKLSTATLNTFLSALTSRSSFITTRQGQLGGYLGTIVQDLSTGNVTGSGLYFERWSFVQLRLNMLGGSLMALKGLERSQSAQNEQVANINSSKATYEAVLKCTAFAAPATNTPYLSVKSTLGFSVGDSVFLIADEQPELVRTIQAIEGNRITFGQPVPANYKDSAFGRIYKDIT